MEQDFGSGSVDTRTEISSVEETPRRIAGLNVGRILNFVIASGAVRPLLVTHPLDQTGPVNGVLFFDPSNDSAESLGVPLLPNKYGHAPLFCLPLSSVPYDELGLLVGSWHWPSRPAASVAASVDPAALSAQLDALMAPILAKIDEKLDSTISTVNLLANSAVNDFQDRNPPAALNMGLFSRVENIGAIAAAGSTGGGFTISREEYAKQVGDPVVDAAIRGDSTPVPETPATEGTEKGTDTPNPENSSQGA